MFYDKKKKTHMFKTTRKLFLGWNWQNHVIRFWYQKSVDCIMQKMPASMENSCIIWNECICHSSCQGDCVRGLLCIIMYIVYKHQHWIRKTAHIHIDWHFGTQPFFCFTLMWTLLRVPERVHESGENMRKRTL